jgi:hypothetical protein
MRLRHQEQDNKILPGLDAVEGERFDGLNEEKFSNYPD